jgi:UPF0176 protein
MPLYNTMSAAERSEWIDKAGQQRLTLSFYAYAQIPDPQQFRDDLFRAWEPLAALGRIYVAHEGINAQMSVPAPQFNDFRDTLEVYPFMQGIRLNVAIEQDNHSFLKLTVKVRHKIVADGLNDDSFDVTNKGIHLKAAEFNALMDDPNTIVVDFRNHYESEIGHFKGAITPDVETFRESLPIINEQLQAHKEDKNLLMYCTGGIRCEKASAYFKHQGFKNVYQLEGGIIEYARQVRDEGVESKFIGKNFVFDHRLGERITNDIIAQCHQCGTPCDVHTNCANEGCHLLFIQCEKCKATFENCCSTDCQETIHLSLVEQIERRKGIQNGNKIFRKGKSEQLIYKQSDHRNDQPLAQAEISAPVVVIPKRIKKLAIGKVQHYYAKSGIGVLQLEQGQLTLGETILIKGPTTGEMYIELTAFKVNGQDAEIAESNQLITLPVPARVRLSDLVYRVF